MWTVEIRKVKAGDTFVWERAGCDPEDIPVEGLVPVMS